MMHPKKSRSSILTSCSQAAESQQKNKKELLFKQFTLPLLTWYDEYGRKDLPWQQPATPYRIWVSEIMLQQTQVKTVIPYFNRFMQRFPDIWQLAEAPEDAILAHWSGLGYYSRARNLATTAKIICEKFAGQLPTQLDALKALPGIGASTAAAIAAQAFNQPAAILDGNVKRVLSRYFLIAGFSEQSAVKQQLWQLANQCMPEERCKDYTQAIMDLGALCCTTRQPKCPSCPLQHSCLANLQQQTHAFPHKKTKKTLPVKQQQFLVLYNAEDKIYLEKRAPTGLWGGLWCLPSIDDLISCPINHIKTQYDLLGLQTREIMNLKHSFSHFHLTIKALAIKTVSQAKQAKDSNGKWFSTDEIYTLGIAKPVADIIQQFKKAPLSR